MSFFLFAGYDTTAAALARILQLLGSKSSKDIVDQLIDEINGTVAAASESELEECPHSREATATKAQRRGVLASYPFLDAVIHEATRYVVRIRSYDSVRCWSASFSQQSNAFNKEIRWCSPTCPSSCATGI